MHAVAAAELVESHLDLALALADHWGRRWGWLADDFRSVASFALWRAAVRFTPDRGEFAKWARRAVRWACCRRLAEEHRTNAAAFARAGPVAADGEILDPIDLLADGEIPPDELAELRDDLAALPAMLAGLTPERRELITRHAEGETFEALAAERGVTGAAVRQQAVRTMAELRRRVEG